MKYRIREYDPVNDIYLLQKHVWWIFWKSLSAGSKKKLEDFIASKEIQDDV